MIDFVPVKQRALRFLAGSGGDGGRVPDPLKSPVVGLDEKCCKAQRHEQPAQRQRRRPPHQVQKNGQGGGQQNKNGNGLRHHKSVATRRLGKPAASKIVSLEEALGRGHIRATIAGRTRPL